MQVLRTLDSARDRGPIALTIGNFDGVHLGHQTMIKRLLERANELGIPACVMTFEPHPREFFAQLSGDAGKAPTRIANLRDKLQSLSDAGIDRVIVESFNAGFAALSPQDFIEKVLVQGLHVKWLIVGEDFRYGARRAGDVAMLIEAGRQYGFHVEALPAVVNDGARISSSSVRAALAQGDLIHAKQLLGHPYAISGHVVHGQKLGRTIGFPTLNLRITHKRPALSGIFVVQVHGLAAQPLPGVASLGIRPTVDDSGRVLLETHVFDYAEQCYGKLVRVEFLKKLRDEEKYVDLPTLTDAIARDAKQARMYFKQRDDFATSATDRI